MKRLLFSLLALALFVSACKTTQTTTSTKTTEPAKAPCGEVTYTSHIAKLMTDHCIKCHGTGGSYEPAHGIALDSYASVAAESKKKHFMGSIHQEEGYDAMPRKAPKLNDADIALIECWIQTGAKQ